MCWTMSQSFLKGPSVLTHGGWEDSDKKKELNMLKTTSSTGGVTQHYLRSGSGGVCVELLYAWGPSSC